VAVSLFPAARQACVALPAASHQTLASKRKPHESTRSCCRDRRRRPDRLCPAVPHRLRRNAGQDQPVILQLLELPVDKAQAALKGVMMELEDCAFPLLAGMVGTDDAEVAFKDADIALLVGARPRGPGMERKDLLLENARSSPPRARR
jgi:hypothetical protein